MKLLFRTSRGILSLCLYIVNTICCCIPIFIITPFKFLVPVPAFRKLCSRLLTDIATLWVGVNILNQKLLSRTNLTVRGPDYFRATNKYLILANHQSWVDILVLQRIFHRRIPFLKFFIKKELFWFPVLGQAWWALDFPFVKRYSKSFLQKKPHLKGVDLKITQRACRKFKTLPVSIMNFVEGTRFTIEKHRRQQSPYKNLLKTKAGGIAHVLASMGDQLNAILDVTIVYPKGAKSFWAFLCGNIHEIKVRVRTIPVTQELLGDYSGDKFFKAGFHTWLNELWAEKDQCVQEML